MYAWGLFQELCSSAGKPRSYSLSSEVSSQSSLGSSGCGSETHLDDPRPQFQSPGMKGEFFFANIKMSALFNDVNERLVTVKAASLIS